MNFALHEFLTDGSHRVMFDMLEPEEAASLFKFYCEFLSEDESSAEIEKVIVTQDEDENTVMVMEWKPAEGVVFPPFMKGRWRVERAPANYRQH